jgi:Sensors of blue-light using FAD
MLVRLLYVSRLNNLSDVALNALTDTVLLEARPRNAAKGITGVLIYSNTMILQLLEGGREQVSALYNRISQDKRHSDVMILSFEDIEQRRFSDWSMGKVNLSKVNSSLLLKYSTTATIDPYATSGKTSLALLEELMATAAIIARS